ncbi:MAG: helix-turn-helix domain-containing protein [Verrucomicrobiota bacterium]
MHAHTRPLTKSEATAASAANSALLTRHEASRQLATCLRTVDEAIAKGDIEVIKIGRSVRIRPSALELFIEARAIRINPRRAARKATARKSATPA